MSWLLGCCLFLVGSALFLPDIGCSEQTADIAVWTFVLGSCFFTVGGALSIMHVVLAKRLAQGGALLPSGREALPPPAGDSGGDASGGTELSPQLADGAAAPAGATPSQKA